MRVAVCGGRNKLPDDREDMIWEFLDKFNARIRVTMFLRSSYFGVANCAYYWAVERRIPQVTFNANSDGVLASHLMLTTMQPQYLIAFPGGPGTEDCVKKAKHEEIEVLTVFPNGWPEGH